jgi:hypothetical protein
VPDEQTIGSLLKTGTILRVVMFVDQTIANDSGDQVVKRQESRDKLAVPGEDRDRGHEQWQLGRPEQSEGPKSTHRSHLYPITIPVVAVIPLQLTVTVPVPGKVSRLISHAHETRP